MSEHAAHEWNFEVFDPRSLWIKPIASPYARSLGLYVLELGHFIQAGHCVVRRSPEESFGLLFSGENTKDSEGMVSYSTAQKTVCGPLSGGDESYTLTDNRGGYTIDQNGYADSFFIQFGGPLASVLYGAFEADCFLVNYHTAQKELLYSVFNRLVQLYKCPQNDMNDLEAFSLLVRLLRELVAEARVQSGTPRQADYVKRALQFIEQDYAVQLRLQHVADRLALDASYLSRLIHSQTGRTFSDCLLHTRLRHAKELLYMTNLPVEEIGSRCGFCNASHFIKAFGRIESMTPLQYRKQVQNSMFVT